jgi:hypothetical protein
MNTRGILWTLLPCAIVLILAAVLRGAEYDEQYTLFLTAGVPRPDWPEGVFAAGLAREIQSGHAGLAAIARDLRLTDVHPPLYFWLVSLWRDLFGHGLFVARLLSVVLGLGALGLIGVIAQVARVNSVWAMLLTLGCYGFTYTSVIARGFALAQLLLLCGIVGLLLGRRAWHFALAGALFGAATLANYLSVFVAGAGLLALGLETFRRKASRDNQLPSPGQAMAALLGFLVFIPADLWWFLAQRGSRTGQFPAFSLTQSLARLAIRFTGGILGGLPLYVDGAASKILAGALGLILAGLIAGIVWRWRHIGTRSARTMFALAAIASPIGLIVLGLVFNNTPIEVRYLAFSTPFAGLLLAGALGARGATALLLAQAASIAGLMLAPQTMQPARAAAHAAAVWVGDGVVLLPRGNDGVGIAGAFAIEAPTDLPLMLIRAADTPEQIRARVGAWHRVVLALVEQDTDSHAASAAMLRALATPEWREVARTPGVAVYERRE